MVVKPGTHYKSARYLADPDQPVHMLAGGHVNLKETPGIGVVPANQKQAEDPNVGAVREIEEEIVDDKGKPVLKNIDPARLKVMHIKTLTPPSGESHLVIAYKLELTPEEASTITAHVAKLESDENYRRAARGHTKNPETGEPEICTVAIHPLKEVAEGQHTLLQEGQRILFKKVYEEENRGIARA